MFRKIRYGILNLIKWLPVIWKDRDWDEGYLLEIMSFKMKNMSELHIKHGSSTNSEKYAKQLKECSELARKLAWEDYDIKDFREEEKQIENDYDKLFSNMRKNIRNWWD